MCSYNSSVAASQTRCMIWLLTALKDNIFPERIWNVWNSFCEWNGTRPFGPSLVRTRHDPFDTEKFSNLSPEILFEWPCPVWTLPLWQRKAEWMSLDPASKRPAFWPPSRRGLGTRKGKLIFSLWMVGRNDNQKPKYLTDKYSFLFSTYNSNSLTTPTNTLKVAQ